MYNNNIAKHRLHVCLMFWPGYLVKVTFWVWMMALHATCITSRVT